jgi:ParB family transcriptional regulator, chromosome partitioning protein
MPTSETSHASQRPSVEPQDGPTVPGVDVIHGRLSRPRVPMRFDHLPTSRIVPNPFQPRRVFDRNRMEDLKGTIRAVGTLQPVTVWQRDNDGFVLISGERRLVAYRELEAEASPADAALYRSIPALIRDLRGIDQDVQLAMLAGVENLVREELKPGERARAMQQLKSMGLTWQEIADRMGLSLVKVQEYAGIGLVDELARAVDEGRVTQVRGVAIARALKPVARSDEKLAAALVPHLIELHPSKTGVVVRAALELPATSSAAERARQASDGIGGRPTLSTDPLAHEEVTRNGERARLTYVVPARTRLATLLRRRRVPLTEWVCALQEHCEEIGVWPARRADTAPG